jgi:hypothetical protein
MNTSDESIHTPFQAFYIQSMLFNSTSAMRSIEGLNLILHELPDAVSSEDLVALQRKPLLYDLQNIVLQGAALSRYFWPIRSKDQVHATRGQALQNAFAIDGSSPLNSRDLRNALEHFDERLDQYLLGDLVGYVIPEYVGFMPEDSGLPNHFFRAYFIDCGIFHLLGVNYLIDPIINAIEDIHQKLRAMDGSGSCF